MNREPGQIVFPANFERNIAAPLDATMKVATLSGLTQSDTFKTLNDGNDYSYVGMFTIVTDDVKKNNGLYILKALPTTDINNWQKIQDSTSDCLLTQSKDIIGAINEVNEKTGDIGIQTTVTNVFANTPTLLQLNNTNTILDLALNAITDYTISLVINSTDGESLLKKQIDFMVNTLNPDNTIITHAYITDDDALNANFLNAVVDVEQIDTQPKLTISITTQLNCVVFAKITKSSNII